MDEWDVQCVYGNDGDEVHHIGPGRKTIAKPGQWYAMPHRPIVDSFGGYAPLYERAIGPFDTEREAQEIVDRETAATSASSVETV